MTHQEDAGQPEEDQPEEEKPAKTGPIGSPIWMYATAASVGVLVLVLAFALLFGGKPPVKVEPQNPPRQNSLADAGGDPRSARRSGTDADADASPPDDRHRSGQDGAGVLELSIMDPSTLKPDRPALHKEYFGPFGNFPEAPDDAVVLRMGRVASGPASFRNLAERAGPGETGSVTVIEIHDNGPIFVPALPPLAQRHES